MIYNSDESEKRAAMAVADLMAAAARTAPKGCGVDAIFVSIIDGREKDLLASDMREIGKQPYMEFFDRDAGNIDQSHCVLLVGVHDVPLGLKGCSLCGFANCAEAKKVGSKCAFKITDLGIAIGSMVSVAANHRMDNRCLYTAGRSAARLHMVPDDVTICFAIPLATLGKSPFFDRPGPRACRD